MNEANADKGPVYIPSQTLVNSPPRLLGREPNAPPPHRAHAVKSSS